MRRSRRFCRAAAPTAAAAMHSCRYAAVRACMCAAAVQTCSRAVVLAAAAAARGGAIALALASGVAAWFGAAAALTGPPALHGQLCRQVVRFNTVNNRFDGVAVRRR